MEWLTGLSGIENGLKFRIAHFLRPHLVDLDPSFKGWPWRPDNASWIEPTAHALVASESGVPKQAATRELRERIESGERMLLDRRCSDGGWNYGNRSVLGVELAVLSRDDGAGVDRARRAATDLAGSIKFARHLLGRRQVAAG